MKTILDKDLDGGHVKVDAELGSSTAEYEAALSEDFTQKLLDDGATEFKSTLYSTLHFGRFFFYKAVGPPPWKYPAVKLDIKREKPFSIRVGVGWRSTLYAAMWMAKNREKK